MVPLGSLALLPVEGRNAITADALVKRKNLPPQPMVRKPGDGKAAAKLLVK